MSDRGRSVGRVGEAERLRRMERPASRADRDSERGEERSTSTEVRGVVHPRGRERARKTSEERVGREFGEVWR